MTSTYSDLSTALTRYPGHYVLVATGTTTVAIGLGFSSFLDSADWTIFHSTDARTRVLTIGIVGRWRWIGSRRVNRLSITAHSFLIRGYLGISACCTLVVVGLLGTIGSGAADRLIDRWADGRTGGYAALLRSGKDAT